MTTDESSTAELLEPPAPHRRDLPCIRWLHGQAPRLVALERARVVLGRSAECDIVLDAAGVSRLHAEIFRQSRVCALADTQSKNGVFVNARRVRHVALAPGDVLRLGEALGVFEWLDCEVISAHAPGVTESLPGITGAGMIDALRDLPQIASASLPVVIEGETGVGKERAAEALHRGSGRAGAFHAVNCAAIPEHLAEAELFGYRKGAFTGAEAPSTGHFRAAHCGTLFLDELQELSPKVQAMLLRALQDGCVLPLGESKAIPVNVRIVAATQVPLAELVASKKLRDDLAMRLSGFVFRIPPLRERRADIATLFFHFLKLHSAHGVPNVEVRCLEELLLHDWPGNARELELLTRRLLALMPGEKSIPWSALPEALRPKRDEALPELSAAPGADVSDRAGYDRESLRNSLHTLGANLTRAAASIGISRQRAYRLLGGKSVEEFLAEAPDTTKRTPSDE